MDIDNGNTLKGGEEENIVAETEKCLAAAGTDVNKDIDADDIPNGGKTIPYKLKHDTVYRHKLVHTACVWFGMAALGWRNGLVGTTFPDLRQIINEDLASSSWIFTAISLGGLIGSVCGGAVYDHLNKMGLYIVLTLGLATCSAATPWCANFVAMVTVHLFHGGCASAIDAVVTTDMVHVWRHEAGPFLQAAHFAFSLGAIISPFVADPFLAQRILAEVQHAHLFNNNTVAAEYNQTRYKDAFFDDSFVLNNSTGSFSKVVLDFQTDNCTLPESNSSLSEGYVYGETKIHVIYLMSTAVSITATALFILQYLCLGSVYNLPVPEINSPGVKYKRRKYKLTKTQKVVLQILIAIILMVYVMNERNVYGFLMTFCISTLNWSKTRGSTITSIFWITFALGRLSGVGMIKIMRAKHVLVTYLGILSVGTFALWLSVEYNVQTLIWISIACVGFGMSVIFASVFGWLSEDIMQLTGKITSILFIFFSFGAMLLPILVGYLMSNVSQMWYIYSQLILVICIGVIFAVANILYYTFSKQMRKGGI